MTVSSFSARAMSWPPRRRASLLGLSGTLLALALASMPLRSASAQDSDPVVARVDGTEIHASDLALAEEDVGSNLPHLNADGRREYLTTFVTDMVLAAKAAEAQKITDQTEFKRRLEYYRNKILMDLMLQSEAKSAVSDAALHKLYDEVSAKMANEKEVHARHILVETEDEAKAIITEIKKGGDFAELAKKKSKDPGGAEGGDLGYFTKDQMVPEFSEVAFKLEKGQLSDPVKTQFGWHIIKVEDKRDRKVPEFDKVKDQLATYLGRRAQAELITKLRKESKIERLDSKPSEPAASDEPKK